ncbi:MAG TPA: lysine biosynthesis protein LysX [Phycisphaerae bacterium]|nr:lysine biosynthesis protein LysX [Phycisphaerae bacterium]
MKVGFLHTIIRPEEKMLLKAFAERSDVELEMIDVRNLVFRLGRDHFDLDVVVERCINHSRALHALIMFEAAGIPCVNTAQVAAICGDKLQTSVALHCHKVPQPRVNVAFTEESAMKALEDLGYPAVLKPAVGSWGRLLSKVNDPDAAETVLEHKTVLGSYHHSIFYMQEYIEKNGRDIRSFVIGDECVAAIYRASDHWITNTARGGKTSNCEITEELRDISLRGARAVNGSVVALDLFETNDGLLVNEVNYTMEFRNSVSVTGVDIPGLIAEHVVGVGRQSKNV